MTCDWVCRLLITTTTVRSLVVDSAANCRVACDRLLLSPLINTVIIIIIINVASFAALQRLRREIAYVICSSWKILMSWNQRSLLCALAERWAQGRSVLRIANSCFEPPYACIWESMSGCRWAYTECVRAGCNELGRLHARTASSDCPVSCHSGEVSCWSTWRGHASECPQLARVRLVIIRLWPCPYLTQLATVPQPITPNSRQYCCPIFSSHSVILAPAVILLKNTIASHISLR